MDKYIDAYQFLNNTGKTPLACDVEKTPQIIMVVLNDK